MSSYPGNPALSAAVKERVLSTFQQAIALLKQGNTDEVVQGCGLILRMDPLFDPAKKLMEKARNPAAPIDVDSLLGAPAAAGGGMSDAQAAFAQRDFQKAIDITTELLTQDLMNEEARVLNEKARNRIEAQPFIAQFTEKIKKAVAANDVSAARVDLDKIRSLDPDNPVIAQLESSLRSASSTSFVVDAPAAPAAGRGTAQASDFGFSFEEEKAPPPAPQSDSGASFSPFSTETGTMAPVSTPAGFNFDAPAAAPPPPPAAAPSFSFDTPSASGAGFAGGGFSFDTPAASAPAPAPTSGPNEYDFTTAPAETSAEDQAKVQQFLADGDRAYEAGDIDQAIDLWSRIFMIDITNDEASKRIEKAKTEKRDTEHRVESTLSSAIQMFDRNDKASARDLFLEVLRFDPNNLVAADYVERIGASTSGRLAAFKETVVPPAEPEETLAPEEPAEEEEVAPPPPSPAARAAAPAKKAATAKAAAAPAKGGLPRVALVIGAVALVGIIGWFAWSKVSKPTYDAAATEATFKQAGTLAQKGQYDLAIAMLQDVKPDDPQHDKALSLIADLQHRKAQASELVGGRPASVVYQEALANGKAAFEAHDYDAAKKALDGAARIRTLPADMQALYDTSAQQVAKLDNAKALFKEQRYQDALTNLQSLAQQDPQNASIRRMITDAHFNLGAAALTEEKADDAIREFNEVLKADPNDDLAKRSKALAERYNGQPKDLLYKIYVKYLPTRRTS